MEGCRLAVDSIIEWRRAEKGNNDKINKNQITSIVTVAHPLDAANEFSCARKQFLKRKTKQKQKENNKKKDKDRSVQGSRLLVIFHFFHRNDEASQENTQRACSNQDQPN